MDISFQLYSSRDVASQEAFLSDLAKFGYTQVEGYGGVYSDPAGFRAALDAAGLTMPSGHFGLGDLDENFAGCVQTAKTLGMSQIFAPYLDESARPTDREGYAHLAKQLSSLNAKAKEHGLGFGWHNHDFELVPLADGSIPLEVILTEAPDIAWEADLAWVVRGGADAAEWVSRFGDRMSSVHVKDIAPEGQNLDQDGWCNVGEGTIDWADLTARARAASPNVLMVMEHDKPADAVEFAESSIAAFKTF